MDRRSSPWQIKIDLFCFLFCFFTTLMMRGRGVGPQLKMTFLKSFHFFYLSDSRICRFEIESSWNWVSFHTFPSNGEKESVKFETLFPHLSNSKMAFSQLFLRNVKPKSVNSQTKSNSVLPQTFDPTGMCKKSKSPTFVKKTYTTKYIDQNQLPL